MAYDAGLILEYLREAHETPLLTEREKHLLGLAVTLTRGCQVCSRGRFEKARAAGIDDDVLNDVVAIVASVNAGVTAATARESFGESTTHQPVDACGELCAPGTSAH
jgi:AhpD family alkylhydroperoxidase